jgi:hypothetical protein
MKSSRPQAQAGRHRRRVRLISERTRVALLQSRLLHKNTPQQRRQAPASGTAACQLPRLPRPISGRVNGNTENRAHC